jgi:hypothetical protein
MKKKILIAVVIAGIIGGGIAAFMFFMPHRDVQATAADFNIEAKQLVDESLADAITSNNKYLAEDGDSKIIAITGTVSAINEDMNAQKVILLKAEGDNAGVSCTFMSSTNVNAEKLSIGDVVTIKGVYKSGAHYDEDMEEYEDVIVEKCDIIIK